MKYLECLLSILNKKTVCRRGCPSFLSFHTSHRPRLYLRFSPLGSCFDPLGGSHRLGETQELNDSTHALPQSGSQFPHLQIGGGDTEISVEKQAQLPGWSQGPEV